ncbi:adhesion G protein-coupled receptor E1 [Suncus etruscus]|uniref:adhesion G protein-coupled receptor E1 n=1 Tax=Suncus etruscus TaxID=109475 RepID=UPI0021106F28|nr:adhesion G protein-coupled receptor E1 [Suncus etruscus]
MWRFTFFLILGPNRCVDTTMCPAYAVCNNNTNSYYCTCKKGFISSNGMKHFRDPQVECKDIDECSQDPLLCGRHAVCQNKPGRYICSCSIGFSSPTGNTWGPGTSDHVSCADNNECLQTGICPEHSKCVNSIGSYHCQCEDGFVFNNSICEDEDECAKDNPCPDVSVCRNEYGSYSCVCNSGFESSGSTESESLDEICEDIDECSQDVSPCGPNSVCTNTMSSYSCRCAPGFRPQPEGSWKYGNFSCKRVPFMCREDVIPENKWVQLCQVEAAMEPKHVSYCAQMNTTLSILDDICGNKTTVVSLKETVDDFASLLKQTPTWSNFTQEETSALATVLLKSVESAVLASLLKPSANASQAVQMEHLTIESKVIEEECNESHAEFHLNVKGNKMQIECSTIKESESTGTTGVALVSFDGMESVLSASFFHDPKNLLANSKRKLKMNSHVIVGIMTGERKEGFSHPIVYTLENIEPKLKSEKPICVTWNMDEEGGRWSRSGCVMLESAENYTVCSCNKLANLAIIMASDELTMDFTLHVISQLGMTISLLCLALAIATFLLCRSLRNQNTWLHLHLCLCLFLAKLLFLAGVDKTGHQTGCAVIAGFLHYFFLACFFWMLVEAVLLFLMVRNLKVVNYFNSRNIKMSHLCALGYGLPGLVVLLSASIHSRGYGMYNRCWLNTETGFIWSFLGPVCVIITVNFILLIGTLWILKQNLNSMNADVSKIKDTRLLTFKAFAQLFILGCSWVLGLFQIGPIAGVMAYLFTIINSLQGAFIFLIHCLLNQQVREEYRKWIIRRTKPSSQSQTSGILLSSITSTSKNVSSLDNLQMSLGVSWEPITLDKVWRVSNNPGRTQFGPRTFPGQSDIVEKWTFCSRLLGGFWVL